MTGSNGAHPATRSVYRLACVMEQTLGHVTHDRNLRRWAEEDPGISADWLPVEYSQRDLWQRAPLTRNNWTVRSSLRARQMLGRRMKRQQFDALLFHTQVISIFSAALMRRVPTVLSMDATPLNVDSVGDAYAHRPSRVSGVEALKNRLNVRAFSAARRLITWCHWAKESLVREYGIEPDRVRVIPPGVDLDRWRMDRADRPRDKVRLLFVGGDFARKGGPELLRAHGELSGACELDIVTRAAVDTRSLPGVRVHAGLGPNSPELIALYQQADIFAFPTKGDCLPIAVMEAMAAGLPVVASCVGALDEEVEDGVTGFLVPPGEVDPLVNRIGLLARDGALRRDMGMAGRAVAEERFDGQRNYRAVLQTLKECADAA